MTSVVTTPRRWLRIFANQETAIVLFLIVLAVVVGSLNPRFLASRNVSDILQGNAYIAIAAIGMTMIIITGNIDISVGSLVGLLAVIAGRIVTSGAPPIVAWVAPLFIGALVGALIGFFVAYLKIPSIVVTLGMLSIFKGFLIIWTAGSRVEGMPPTFFLAQWDFLGIPVPIFLMIVLTILAALWMRYSAVGRSLYAVGGNPEAARLSGISQQRVVLQAFMLNGAFVGIASTMYATQLSVIQATPPPSLELFVITSAVVGGVSILGGKGTVIGAVLAAILLNAIRSSMVFINVSPFWIQAVQGLLILITVLIDLIRRKREMFQ
jgi:ribose/xylose/arabinose/galactoside ABC-type transport system permease subunit